MARTSPRTHHPCPCPPRLSWHPSAWQQDAPAWSRHRRGAAWPRGTPGTTSVPRGVQGAGAVERLAGKGGCRQPAAAGMIHTTDSRHGTAPHGHCHRSQHPEPCQPWWLHHRAAEAPVAMGAVGWPRRMAVPVPPHTSPDPKLHRGARHATPALPAHLPLRWRLHLLQLGLGGRLGGIRGTGHALRPRRTCRRGSGQRGWGCTPPGSGQARWGAEPLPRLGWHSHGPWVGRAGAGMGEQHVPQRSSPQHPGVPRPWGSAPLGRAGMVQGTMPGHCRWVAAPIT